MNRDQAVSSFLAKQEFAIRKLDDDHFIEFFDCGRDENMNRWFTGKARQWQEEDICSVWVMSPIDNETDVVGFFALAAHTIIPSNLPRGDRANEPRHSQWINAWQRAYPAHLLGKFALDSAYQGRGLGALLMFAAYEKQLAAADTSGAKYLVVDVRETELIHYYNKSFGFKQSGRPGDLIQMYKQTSVIREELDEIING